jgi:hypothetical protein
LKFREAGRILWVRGCRRPGSGLGVQDSHRSTFTRDVTVEFHGHDFGTIFHVFLPYRRWETLTHPTSPHHDRSTGQQSRQRPDNLPVANRRASGSMTP